MSPIQVATPDPYRRVSDVQRWRLPYTINSPQWEGVKAPAKPGGTPPGRLRAQCARQDDKIKHREKRECCWIHTPEGRVRRVNSTPRAYLLVAMTGLLWPNHRRGGNSYKISLAIVGLTRRDSGSQSQIH